MIKVYCELGSLNREIKALKSESDLEFIYFPFENKTRKLKSGKNPSNLLASNGFVLASSDIRISDTIGSDKFGQIQKLIGEKNFRDAQHIDTAYKENCKLLISPDRKDIINFRKEIYNLTGVKCFHHTEIESIIEYINRLREIQ